MDIGYVIVFAIIFIIVFSLVHKKRKEKRKIQLFEEVIQKRFNDLKHFRDMEPFIFCYDSVFSNYITPEKDALLTEIPDLMVEYEKAFRQLAEITQDNVVFMDDEQHAVFIDNFHGTKEELIERARQDILRSWFPIIDFIKVYNKLFEQICWNYLLGIRQIEFRILGKEWRDLVGVDRNEEQEEKMQKALRQWDDLVSAVLEDGVTNYCLRTICRQYPQYNNDSDKEMIKRFVNGREHEDEWVNIFIAGMSHVIENERAIYSNWYIKLYHFFHELHDSMGNPSWLNSVTGLELSLYSPFPLRAIKENFDYEKCVRDYARFVKNDLTDFGKDRMVFFTLGFISK